VFRCIFEHISQIPVFLEPENISSNLLTHNHMKLEKLKISHTPGESKKLIKASKVYEKLLRELRSREIPDDIISIANHETEAINNSRSIDTLLAKEIKKATHRMIKLLTKQLNLVPKNHYRTMWMGIGMAAFGVPLGVSYGVVFDNMAFMGIGIPIGMVIGMAVGISMDKKAISEGRQLDIDYEL
jgi:hypothetical protein